MEGKVIKTEYREVVVRLASGAEVVIPREGIRPGSYLAVGHEVFVEYVPRVWRK